MGYPHSLYGAGRGVKNVRNINDHKEIRRYAARGRAGFSMLEVMACLVVLTVAVTIFVGAVAQNVRLEAMNAETNVALHAASSVIEDIHTMTYAEVAIGTVPETFKAEGAANDGRTLRLQTSANSPEVGRVTIIENGSRTKKTVEASVTWRSATGADRTILLMTEVTNY